MHIHVSPKKHLLIGLVIAAFFYFPLATQATTTCTNTGSSITISNDCDLPLTTNGFDGPVTVGTGGIFRIGNSVQNQTIYLPKIILNGGSIISNATGSKMVFSTTSVGWMLDADDDKWPATTEKRFQTTAPTADWKRLNTMVNTSTVDCYDSNNLAKPDFGTTPTPIFKTAHRGDGSFDYNCNGGSVGTDLQYTGNAQYVCSTTGCAAHYYSNVSGWVGSSGYPACGASKDYNTAQGAGIDETCTASNCNVSTASRTQGCR